MKKNKSLILMAIMTLLCVVGFLATREINAGEQSVGKTTQKVVSTNVQLNAPLPPSGLRVVVEEKRERDIILHLSGVELNVRVENVKMETENSPGKIKIYSGDVTVFYSDVWKIHSIVPGVGSYDFRIVYNDDQKIPGKFISTYFDLRQLKIKAVGKIEVVRVKSDSPNVVFLPERERLALSGGKDHARL